MPVMRVLSHMTLKSKIHLLNYSGIWYTAHDRKILELWSPALHPLQKILRAPRFCQSDLLRQEAQLVGKTGLTF